MSSEEPETVSLTHEGAVNVVEKLRGRELPDVFADTSAEQLRRIAESLEEQLDDFAEDPMRNRSDIEDTAFKIILLRQMAGDDGVFGARRSVDDEDEMESDGNGGTEDLGDLDPDDMEEIEQEGQGNNGQNQDGQENGDGQQDNGDNNQQEDDNNEGGEDEDQND